MLLNDQSITKKTTKQQQQQQKKPEKIKEEKKKYLEMNKMKTQWFKPMAYSKSSPKNEVYSHKNLPQETEKNHK